MYQPKEDATVKEIAQKLQAVGWQDGTKLIPSFSPHSAIGGFYFKDLLQSKVEAFNPTIFQSLQPHEKNELWSIVAGTLDTNDPIKMLDYFKYGSEVVYKKKRLRIRFFDFEHPENNIFFYLPEVVYYGSHNSIKPDYTLFVNGWPIAIIEAKNKLETNSYQNALNQIDRYEREAPQLFNFVQLGIAYGDQVRYLGTWPNHLNQNRQNRQHFTWREENSHQSAIENLLQLSRILDYLKNYTFFVGSQSGKTSLFKLTARYMQYFAAEKVFHRAQQYLEGKSSKNKGLVWHWQGSGKTYAMFFAAHKFFSYAYDKEPVVFFILDRRSLVKQLFESLNEIHFADKSKFHQVANVKDLESILKNIRQTEISGNVIHRGLYVTTLQKFTKGDQENIQYDTEGIFKLLDQYGAINKKEILILFDEAHRSLYGDQGSLVNAVLPQALKFGFTGTPVLQKERNTFNLFAYPNEKEFYLDRYFINQSLQDGFTLKLTYKTVKEEGFDFALDLEETKALVEQMLYRNQESLSEAELNVQTSQITTHLTKAKTILTNKTFIQKKAEYIVQRLEKDTENFQFKAMVVVSGKQACVRYKQALDKALLKHFGSDAQDWVEVVVSWGQNEKQELEIYRQQLYQRFSQQDTDEINQTIVRQFKKPDKDPKILIVTDMLLTGFDAPILKVIYLDKLLYGHRLLQTITRTNRPYPAKHKQFGLIVDFVGIFSYLQKTMAFYNQFEDPQVKQDFQDNLIDNLDAILDEFIRLFNQSLDQLKHLSVHGQDFSLYIHQLVSAIDRQDLTYFQAFDEKLAGLALYLDEELAGDSDQQHLFNLWGQLYRLLRLYRALGAHPRKTEFMKPIGALQFLLHRVRQLQQRLPENILLDQSFWDKLDQYLASKTKVGRIKEIKSLDLNPTVLQKMRGNISPTRLNIAHFYYQLKHQFQNSQDPVYLVIYKRIKNLHTQWMQDKLSSVEFLNQLKTAKQETDEYRKTIQSKSLPERIIIGLNKSIINQFLTQPAKLNFDHLQQILQQIDQSPSQFVNTLQRKQLAEAFLTDLFIEAGSLLKPDIETKLDQQVRDLIDLFIVPLIERNKLS